MKKVKRVVGWSIEVELYNTPTGKCICTKKKTHRCLKDENWTADVCLRYPGLAKRIDAALKRIEKDMNADSKVRI